MKKVLEAICDLFFPLPEEDGGRWLLQEPFCGRCAQPFHALDSSPESCPNCHGTACHFDHARAMYLSRGSVRDMIHQFKYERAFWLRRRLVPAITDGYRRFYDGWGHHAIVYVPLFSKRERWREFNQSEVLAEGLGLATGLPVLKALRRSRETTVQAKLDRVARRSNVRGAFDLTDTAQVVGKKLILIDDVLTTGSTAGECARLLKKGGAAQVDVLVVARG